MIAAGPVSPCVGVCMLDAAQRCIGCRRTLDEIVRWSRMSPVEQWAVIARLEQVRTDEAPLTSAALAATR
jgi:predicted Fe-S protein YdhL (DUF1289 family)